MISDQVCPLCGERVFHGYRLELLECGYCGLVVSPMIWEAQTNERMEEAWFGEDYKPKSSFWVDLFESWNNRRTLARLEKAGFSGKRLLEIGVGSGSFLQAARQSGFDVVGCDLSAPLCRRVEQRYGIPMHCGPLDTIQGEGRFDVVVMNHVLEHVQQPVAFLASARRLLVPGGGVHLAVPNIACWEARLPGWTSYEPYHLSYFNARTLSRTITAAGLSIEQSSTHESFSGWFLAIVRSALGVNWAPGAVVRAAPSSSGHPSRRRSRLIEQVYRFAMVCTGGAAWPLRAIQSRLGAGDEAICLARKVDTGSAI